MKVIIPLAGKGTRLRPHTHTVPKPMLRVAGKPVMDYVLDDVRRLGGVDEVVYITGHLKEAVEAHARDAYADLPAAFIEQNVRSHETVMGDLGAQVSACHVGCERLREICEEMGWPGLQGLAGEIVERSEAVTRAEIAKLPKGTWTHEQKLDIEIGRAHV